MLVTVLGVVDLKNSHNLKAEKNGLFGVKF